MEPCFEKLTSAGNPAALDRPSPPWVDTHKGQLWIAVEGSSLALALDPDTLTENERVEVSGLPRSLASDGERIYIHGNQSFEQHAVGGTASQSERIPVLKR